MKKLNISIVFLISIFLFTAVILTAQPFGMSRDNTRIRALDKLDLTKAQKDAIENLRYDMKTKTIDLRAKMEQNRLQIEKLFEEENIDRDAVMKLVDENSSLRNELHKMRMNRRLEINSLLTAEQKAELQDLRFIRGNRGFNNRGCRFENRNGQRWMGRHHRGNPRW